MTVYFVTYDLRAPGRNYQPLYDRLAAWKAVHALESVWFIDTTTSASAIRDDLKSRIDSNDQLLVAAMSGESAWTTLMPGAGQFLQSKFGAA